MRGVSRKISVMQLLSSECWAHKFVVQFREAYHSDGHFYFIMEFGGPETLHRRLQQRGARPLSSVTARLCCFCV